MACGAPRAEPAPAREQRKTLTILFCDVAGSTALGEQLDPEALRRVMRRYFEEMTAVIERHGGTVEKFIGDAVVAVFGIPHVREDDALRAVRAAAEIRERLPEVAQELGVALTFRTGINTGEVVVGAGQTLATGDAMNVAARLEQAAPPGEILIGADSSSGQIYSLAAGDAHEAARLARKSYDAGGALGDTSYRPTTGAHLAMALAACGQLDEAEAVADEVDAMSADADVINFVMTRVARARVAAARGDRDRAKQLARQGIDFALQTDFTLWHGYAYEALVNLDPDDSEARERMLEAFRLKGYQPGLQAYS